MCDVQVRSPMTNYPTLFKETRANLILGRKEGQTFYTVPQVWKKLSIIVGSKLLTVK